MRGRGHIFDDPQVLQEMLDLRKQGVGLSELGRHYGVDHSTIYYHSQRHGIVGDREGKRQPTAVITRITASGVIVEAGTPRRVVVSMQSTAVLTDWNGEVLNKGKTYAEYVAYTRRIEQIKKFGHALLPEPKPPTDHD